MTSVKRLSTAWTQGLKGKEKEDFEKTLYNSGFILERLKEVLEAHYRRILDSESSEAQYDTDWMFLQAHRNGEKQILRDLMKLVAHLD